MSEQDSARGTTETDRRLHRLLILSDGVFAIALTLLAVQLALPKGSGDLRGDALLPALLASWPKVLAYINSFTVIAIFWQAHHRLFLQVRRFDGILLWLVFLQLGCIGFIPFPTAVIGGSGSQQAITCEPTSPSPAAGMWPSASKLQGHSCRRPSVHAQLLGEVCCKPYVGRLFIVCERQERPSLAATGGTC